MIIKKSAPIFVETHREVYSSVSWHVRSNAWHPPTDVFETEDSIVVKMEIAGIKDEDLEVLLQENILVINGNRSDSSERRAYHQMEIPYGKFSVGIDLPVPIDTEDAKAEYKDGFLMIHLPKKAVEK